MKLPMMIVLAMLASGHWHHARAADDGVQIANPASVNCIKLGGRLELRKEEGGTVGYCHLPDGRVIEEWTLFRSGSDQPKK